MSLLAKIKGGLSKVDDGRGLTGMLVEKGERYGSSFAFGFIKGYYREKAMIKGMPVDLLAGAGMTLAACVLEAYSGGRSKIAPHLHAIGDAGMMSYINSVGVSMGTKQSGRKIYLLEKGAAAPAGIKEAEHILGELPPAVGGPFLSADEIAKFASPR